MACGGVAGAGILGLGASWLGLLTGDVPLWEGRGMENVLVRRLTPDQVVRIRAQAAETIDAIIRNTEQAPPGLVEAAVETMWEKEFYTLPPIGWVDSPILGAIDVINPGLLAPAAARGLHVKISRDANTTELFAAKAQILTNAVTQWQTWGTSTSPSSISITGNPLDYQGGLISPPLAERQFFSEEAWRQLQDAVLAGFQLVAGSRRNPTFRATMNMAMRSDIDAWTAYHRNLPIPAALAVFVHQWSDSSWRMLWDTFGVGRAALARQPYESWFVPVVVANCEAAAYILGDHLPEDNRKIAEARKTIATYTSGIWPYPDKKVVLSRRPVELRTNVLRQAHHATLPAAMFADGWGFHAFEGQVIPAWDDKSGMSVAEVRRARVYQIHAASSMDSAHVMIRRWGWPEYLRSLTSNGELPEHSMLRTAIHAFNAVHVWPVGLVYSDPGNPGGSLRLYRIQLGSNWSGEIVLRLLVCTNGTPEPDGTRKEYGIVVPSDFEGDALDAAAWAYGLKRRQYARLARRT